MASKISGENMSYLENEGKEKLSHNTTSYVTEKLNSKWIKDWSEKGEIIK